MSFQRLRLKRRHRSKQIDWWVFMEIRHVYFFQSRFLSLWLRSKRQLGLICIEKQNTRLAIIYLLLVPFDKKWNDEYVITLKESKSCCNRQGEWQPASIESLLLCQLYTCSLYYRINKSINKVIDCFDVGNSTAAWDSELSTPCPGSVLISSFDGLHCHFVNSRFRTKGLLSAKLRIFS